MFIIKLIRMSRFIDFYELGYLFSTYRAFRNVFRASNAHAVMLTWQHQCVFLLHHANAALIVLNQLLAWCVRDYDLNTFWSDLYFERALEPNFNFILVRKKKGVTVLLFTGKTKPGTVCGAHVLKNEFTIDHRENCMKITQMDIIFKANT